MSRLRLTVYNIGWACAKSDLRSYFKKFGQVQQVTIPMNYETGFNKNVAFVTLRGNGSSDSDLFQDFHVIDGQEVSVTLRDSQIQRQRNPKSEQSADEVLPDVSDIK